MEFSEVDQLKISTWIKNETQDLEFIGKRGYGQVFSFTDPHSKMKKVLKVLDYEKHECNIDFITWASEAKHKIDALKLLKVASIS